MEVAACGPTEAAVVSPVRLKATAVYIPREIYSANDDVAHHLEVRDETGGQGVGHEVPRLRRHEIHYGKGVR